ncbi:colicin immunity domain-containing protein [Amycolatopsis pigmentata]|uniref:Colicin immunity domain-containing protein n=1 Tax=Amycolatopsis pigmentata TaxID=450801 RepID=A0ABW5FIE6_9PSEU
MSTGPVRSDLVDYVALIDRFVDREIDAEQFETEYLQLVKNDEVIHGEPAFGVIDELFFYVDEYFVFPDASDDDRSREQETLRVHAREAAAKLRSITK